MHPIRPRFPPPTIFATDHQQNYLALTAALLSRSMIEDVLFRLDPGSEGNWPGCIKPCVIVVTVLVKHSRMVDERYEGSFWCIYFRFFFFFFFLPFSRDVLFRLTRVESSTMTRLKERERGREGEQRVIINTWKIAVVILETGEMDYWCDVLFRSTRDDVFPDSIKGSTMYHHCWYNEKRTVLMLLLFLQRSKKTVGLFRPR